MSAVLRISGGTLDAAELAGLVMALHLARQASASSVVAPGGRSVLIPPPFVPPHSWTCREPGRP
ncbi:hypothetical protein [Actinomadura terrae]|uniref:hypothetical protein n=1 Tax=Actinomadura terrae TaxID=604353 RepID=UPI001FA756B0|nr:hypothetical protein [Actinomadura terrae]